MHGAIVAATIEATVAAIVAAIVAAAITATIAATVAPTGCGDDRLVYTPFYDLIRSSDSPELLGLDLHFTAEGMRAWAKTIL